VNRPAAGDLEATCVLPAQARLGESPVWCPDDSRLYWIDIDRRTLHRFDPATGLDEQRLAPGRPGSLALTTTQGRLLVAIEGGLAFIDWPSGMWVPWIGIEPEGVGNRLNDGRCDPAGRFWVGSMFDPAAAGKFTGLLHRVGQDGTVTTVRSGVGAANGLAFAPDGRTMYFADTLCDVVWAYDYDIDHGQARSERVFLDFGPLRGRPDGAAVDEAGCYWIACIGGSMILRVTPAGVIDQRIRVPVSKPTMPAFGGQGLSTLFITTIGGGGSHPVDPAQPEAGGLFAIDVGVRGLPETRFAGGPNLVGAA
jgi:sugar lactone lactonase YvrE